MSFTGGDDPNLDAEVEGRQARRQGRNLNANAYHQEINYLRWFKWRDGWLDEDRIMKEEYRRKLAKRNDRWPR